MNNKGITQECQQRAKCLTGDAEVTLRAKVAEEAELKKQAEEQRVKMLATRKRDEDMARVKKLCTVAKLLPPSEDQVANCTLEHLAKAFVADDFKGFILARHPIFKQPKDIKNLRNPRTALVDAKAGAENLLSVAYSCRANKSRLLAASSANGKDQASSTRSSTSSNLSEDK